MVNICYAKQELTSTEILGVSVAFGGYTANVAQPILDSQLPDPELYWQMQNISLYDIANQKWYQQQASGDIPP